MNISFSDRRFHKVYPRHRPRLNKSFNLDYDQYYARSDRSNTNQDFSMDQDNNYEPNTNFTSNTNPNSGSNYNQQFFDDDFDRALKTQRMSSHLLNWDGPKRGPHYGKGPKGYKHSDEKIKEQVCEALYGHDEIDASEIEVFVNSGVVKLCGSILDRQMKRMAEGVIEYLPGVEDVLNELILKLQPSR